MALHFPSPSEGLMGSEGLKGELPLTSGSNKAKHQFPKFGKEHKPNRLPKLVILKQDQRKENYAKAHHNQSSEN